MRVSSRRRFLVLSGAMLGNLAGCFSAPEGSASGPTDTVSATPTGGDTIQSEGPPTQKGNGNHLDFADSYESEGHQVYLSDPFTRHALLYQTSPDAVGVGQNPGRQFFFVTVSAEGDQAASLEPTDFAMEVGKSSFPGWRRYGNFEGGYGEFSGAAEEFGRPFGRNTSSGWLGFAVPVPIQEDEPELVLDLPDGSVTWSLPPDLVATLSHLPPDWEVTDFSIAPGDSSPDPRTVSLTIYNRGEGEGSFPLGVNYSGSVHAYETFRVTVPPLEKRTWSDPLTVGDRAPAFEVVTPVETFQGDPVETG
ncbi:MAG: hypothetical protein ABEJ27_01510 [Halodesulfurarchaeum sp.]